MRASELTAWTCPTRPSLQPRSPEWHLQGKDGAGLPTGSESPGPGAPGAALDEQEREGSPEVAQQLLAARAAVHEREARAVADPAVVHERVRQRARRARGVVREL